MRETLTRVGLAVDVIIGLALIGLPFATWNDVLKQFGAPLYLGSAGPAGTASAEGRIVIGAGVVLIVVAVIAAGPVRTRHPWLPALALAPLATAWAATCAYLNQLVVSTDSAAISFVLAAVIIGVPVTAVATPVSAARRGIVVVIGVGALVVGAVLAAAITSPPSGPIVH